MIMNYHTLPNRRHKNRRLLHPSIAHTRIKFIEFEGFALHEIFRKSLCQLADVLKTNICSSAKHYNNVMHVEIHAENREQLLFKFLNSILKLSAERKTIYCSMNIIDLNNTSLSAQVFGIWYDALDFEVKSIFESECIIQENSTNNCLKSSILFEIKKV